MQLLTLIKNWLPLKMSREFLSSASASSSSLPIVATRLSELAKFCIVGGSGVFVDMLIIFLLADPRCLGLNLILSKLVAAEVALINNFAWNEMWTFRVEAETHGSLGRLRRLMIFNVICGAGIMLATGLLHVFHHRLGWNIYLGNLTAIILATCWNYGMNARFNWKNVGVKRRNS